MANEHYEIIIVPVDKKIAANLDADKVDSGQTSKTFTAELSKDGTKPATHLWCCWWVTDEENSTFTKQKDDKAKELAEWNKLLADVEKEAKK